jgi:hypothetical protein
MHLPQPNPETMARHAEVVKALQAALPGVYCAGGPRGNALS